MQVKKIMLGLTLFAAFLAGGCSQQKRQSKPALSKTQVIERAKKNYKSGQVIQSVRMQTDTATQVVAANTIYGGTPTVFHLNNQISSNGKNQNSEEWVNENDLYLNGRSGWYKANLQTISGHDYAELEDAAMNNQFRSNPDAVVTKAYRMHRKGQTYTLKATLTNHHLMEEALTPIVNTVSQSTSQEAVFKRMQKYGKLQKMQLKIVLNRKQLLVFNVFVTLRLGKLMHVRFGQSYGNFGSHDFLRVPTTALNAKPLPKVKATQRTSK